ncbi:MAG: BamA/TamA family outer membrane protein [Pseudomonadota bacterium]
MPQALLHRFVAAALLAGAGSQSVMAQSAPAEPVDDVSTADAGGEKAEASKKEGRFGKILPVPIFVTEPAIGEGLGAALVYFHKPPAEKPKLLTAETVTETARRSKPPPTATGIFAAYTNNGTQGAGIGHARTMREDKYRLVAAAADLKVITETFASDVPFEFQLKGAMGYASIKRRFGDSQVFIGLSALAIDAAVDFRLDLGDEVPPPSLFGFDFQNYGLALSAIYDGRDDTMMPSSGQLVDLTTWRYDDAFGSDFEYTTTRLKAHSFHQWHDRFVMGFRLDVSTVGGEPPFFAVPYVSLRGIPALRYQGKTAGVVETEARYQFSKRWAAIAFVGGGFTNTGNELQETQDDILAGGLGIRFKAIKQQNVWVGLDIARGPEDYAWYIQVGHPW